MAKLFFIVITRVLVLVLFFGGCGGDKDQQKKDRKTEEVPEAFLAAVTMRELSASYFVI